VQAYIYVLRTVRVKNVYIKNIKKCDFFPLKLEGWKQKST